MNRFSPRQLLSTLQRLPVCRQYWLAYSGGRDSHVLLHALAMLREELSATLQVVHIDHGLHRQSSQWSQHCKCVCEALQLPLIIRRVHAHPEAGESPEAAARRARYTMLASLLVAGDILLTAHHQDDQAETLLLQLLRGAGPHGLAAMPEQKNFANGILARPLLAFTRAELQAYADQYALCWLDDPSNDEHSFRRNYLRHQVMPALQARWPASAHTMSRSARLCAEAASLLDELAAQDLATITHGDGLSISGLQALTPTRQRNILRYWCVHRSLPLPGEAHIHQLQQQMGAAADGSPMVCWPGVEVRRYQDCWYFMPPLQPLDTTMVLDWDTQTPLILPHGCLSAACSGTGVGLVAEVLKQHVTVRFRRGGERWPNASGRHQALKKILQRRRVAPWLRNRLPLIFINDELAAVADMMVSSRYAARAGQAAIQLTWQTPEAVSLCRNDIDN